MYHRYPARSRSAPPRADEPVPARPARPRPRRVPPPAIQPGPTTPSAAREMTVTHGASGQWDTVRLVPEGRRISRHPFDRRHGPETRMTAGYSRTPQSRIRKLSVPAR
ncbi:hypothetical protein Pma05_16720 [Plantactinospora mayteni]|uniref:Uncharacterized protein n=1 Tax=Plantactinospora mayteni TaxID=566021 RepID=A0ABQ4EK58_9ACTN|nr:hypothetical protein Pma05_16720 [Plantactinospora mayteni]